MRTAVPLSLLVVEILRSMGEHPHQNPTLGVAFSTRGEALVLSLVCGSDLSDEEAASQGTLETMDKLPDENGIIGILTGQLRGDCRILRTESSILYTVSFVPERLVP